jgi:hypothetical protein
MSRATLFNPASNLIRVAGEGFGLPVVTTAIRTALGLSTGDRGTAVWDQDLAAIFVWDGSAWDQIATGAGTTPFSFSQTTFGGRTFDVITGAGTTMDFVINGGNGTAAIMRQVPDGTSTGGNARGNNSFDLQTFRSAANQVASGYASFAMGDRSRASGDYSFAFGGLVTSTGTNAFAVGTGVTASGSQSVCIGNSGTASAADAVSIGNGCNATATGAVAIGTGCNATASETTAMGRGCTASVTRGVAIGAFCTASGNAATSLGDSNTASGTGAAALNQSNTAAGNGSLSHGSRATSPRSYQRSRGFGAVAFAVGAAQRNELSAFNTTTGAGAITLFVDGNAEQLVLPLNTVWHARVRITAMSSVAGTNEFACWERRVIVRVGATVGTVTVAADQTIGTDVGSNAGSPPAAWSFTTGVDAATGALVYTGTAGVAGVRFTVDLDMSQLSFP